MCYYAKPGACMLIFNIFFTVLSMLFTFVVSVITLIFGIWYGTSFKQIPYYPSLGTLLIVYGSLGMGIIFFEMISLMFTAVSYHKTYSTLGKVPPIIEITRPVQVQDEYMQIAVESRK
jgi:hypothetical protein